MTYQINKKTLLFTNLTEDQAHTLYLLSIAIQLHGYTNMEHPAFLEWCEVAIIDENQKLMVYSTVFSSRVALSAARYYYLG